MHEERGKKTDQCESLGWCWRLNIVMHDLCVSDQATQKQMFTLV